MFTAAYELIICVTPCNRKGTCFIRKKTEDHSTLDPAVSRWVIQYKIQRKEIPIFFSQN